MSFTPDQSFQNFEQMEAPSSRSASLSSTEKTQTLPDRQVRVSESLRAELSTGQTVRFPVVELAHTRGPVNSVHPHPYGQISIKS